MGVFVKSGAMPATFPTSGACFRFVSPDGGGWVSDYHRGGTQPRSRRDWVLLTFAGEREKSVPISIGVYHSSRENQPTP